VGFPLLGFGLTRARFALVKNIRLPCPALLRRGFLTSLGRLGDDIMNHDAREIGQTHLETAVIN
jgi:hypothetical protein